MVNKSKILSDLSKIAVDAMGTFSSIKKEIETIVKLRVNKAINKMDLVKREEFEILKKVVQKLRDENNKNYKKKNLTNNSNKTKKKPIKRKEIKKIC